MLYFYILFFVFGTIVGSFLNVVINRLEIKESIIRRRSYCLFCKKTLNWYELIPILSFFLQKRKCRKCKNIIASQYPLVEIATGLIFVLILNFQFTVSTIFLLLISCFLIIIFVYDLKHYLVLDKIIYPAIVLVFLYNLFYSLFIVHYLLAGLIGGGFFLFIVLMSRGKWMGMGDVKIGVLMGLLLGLTHLFTALFLA